MPAIGLRLICIGSTKHALIVTGVRSTASSKFAWNKGIGICRPARNGCHTGNSWPDLEASWLAEASDRPEAEISGQPTDADAPHAEQAAASGVSMSGNGASGGPHALADDREPILSQPDVGTPEERLTSMVEQCLAWGGEQRLRLQVTLSTSGAALRVSRCGNAVGCSHMLPTCHSCFRHAMASIISVRDQGLVRS